MHPTKNIADNDNDGSRGCRSSCEAEWPFSIEATPWTKPRLRQYFLKKLIVIEKWEEENKTLNLEVGWPMSVIIRPDSPSPDDIITFLISTGRLEAGEYQLTYSDLSSDLEWPAY